MSIPLGMLHSQIKTFFGYRNVPLTLQTELPARVEADNFWDDEGWKLRKFIMNWKEYESPLGPCILFHEWGHILVKLSRQWKTKFWENELVAWNAAEILCKHFLHRTWNLTERKFINWLVQEWILDEPSGREGYFYVLEALSKEWKSR